jgi:hypothetical protein
MKGSKSISQVDAHVLFNKYVSEYVLYQFAPTPNMDYICAPGEITSYDVKYVADRL